MIASAGIGATAAFLLLHNLLNTKKRKEEEEEGKSERIENHQSSKSRGDFGYTETNLNSLLLLYYMYINCLWKNNLLRCHV